MLKQVIDEWECNLYLNNLNSVNLNDMHTSYRMHIPFMAMIFANQMKDTCKNWLIMIIHYYIEWSLG